MSTPTISFDLDGTLIDGPTGAALRDLDRRLASEHGHPGLGPVMRARHRRLLARGDIAAYDWESILAEALDDAGITLDFDLIEQVRIRSRDSVRVLHADTPDALARLSAAGWRLVLLTNGWRRYQVPALAAAGLLDAFDALVTSDDVGVAKPDARMFAAARGEAADHVHVGDRVDHDVVGGHRAGARTVLMRPDVPAPLVLDPTTEEAAAYVERIARGEAAETEQDLPAPDPSEQVPDAFARNLHELGDWVLS